MAAPVLTKIDLTGITTVGFTNGPGQAFFLLRHSNQVDVIGHKAPRPYLYLMFGEPFRHQ